MKFKWTVLALVLFIPVLAVLKPPEGGPPGQADKIPPAGASETSHLATAMVDAVDRLDDPNYVVVRGALSALLRERLVTDLDVSRSRDVAGSKGGL